MDHLLIIESLQKRPHYFNQQIPDIRPEPYHGSVSQIVRPNHPTPLGSRSYQTLTMPGSIGYSGTRSLHSKYLPYGPLNPMLASANSVGSDVSSYDALASNPFMIGSQRNQLQQPLHSQQQPLPYALVPAVQTFPFGMYHH